MRVVKTIGILLLLPMLMFGCVTTGNQYQTNATVGEQVTKLMERYEMYYQLATPEVQAEWKRYFDPMFEELDLLMNTYDQMVMDGMDTLTVLTAIDRLKSQLMLELIRRNQENGE